MLDQRSATPTTLQQHLDPSRNSSEYAFFHTDFGEKSGLVDLLPDISPPPAWLGVEYDSVSTL